jgi:hypothetical protein
MAVEVITREDLNQFRTLLLREMNEIINSKAEFSKKWLKASEVRELLSISESTLQNLHIKGILTYTKIGALIFYSHNEIEKMLETNKVDSIQTKLNNMSLRNTIGAGSKQTLAAGQKRNF